MTKLQAFKDKTLKLLKYLCAFCKKTLYLLMDMFYVLFGCTHSNLNSNSSMMYESAVKALTDIPVVKVFTLEYPC